MARLSPIATAALIGISLAATSFVLPDTLAEPSLPKSIFYTIDQSQPQPTLSVTATREGTGWRIDMATENWIFTDLCSTTKSRNAVGHAHIYLDDVEVGTATLPVFYIDDLPHSGAHILTVSLRSLDHRVVVGENGTISAQTILNHPET